MAGIFPADPGFAFPPGTPDVPGVMSGTGAVHMAAATVSFLSMITFCLAQSRRFTGAWAASGRVAAALLAIGLLWRGRRVARCARRRRGRSARPP